MRERKEKIISILRSSNEWITGKEMSKIFNVSDRTIRSDIEKINREYDNPVIEANKRKGYHIREGIILKVNSVVEDIPQSPRERIYYILRKLLFNKSRLNIFELQEELFVSEFSIENDIKEAKKLIEPYEKITLERSRNFIYLEGEERYKRKVYKELLTKETKGNFLNLSNIAKYYKDFDLLEIADEFNETVEKHNYHIQGTTIILLMIHLGVAIERIMTNHHMKFEEESTKLKNSVEYEIAEEFYHSIARKLDIVVPESEVKILAVLIMGKRSSEYISRNEKNSIKVEQLVQMILDDIIEKFDINFSEDQLLLNGLTMHIESLLLRTLNQNTSVNIYLKDIKWKYPLIFEMAIQVSVLIRQITGLDISEDEIGFITLHLGAAYERINQDKFSVVLIHPSKQSISNICEDKIITHFGDRIRIVERFDYFDQRKVMKENPDIIITTLPLEHNLPIPTVLISLFVSYEDEGKIFSVLNHLEKNKYRKKYADEIYSLFKQEFFYETLDLGTREEVIDFMCQEIIDKGYAEEGFRTSVHARESMASTSFSYSFAIPHPLEVSSKESILSVAIMKNPIAWGEYEVRLVILLGFAENDQKIMKVFLDWMSSVLSDSKALAQLIKSQNKDEFIKNFL
ncbi:MAG TPA: BglG family transcription antiterminator [Proteiniclasticum sp.]|nr:BglG family transcription antiterminator [Proteiniclasticum sp.]